MQKLMDDTLGIVSKFRKAFLSSYHPVGSSAATEYQADQLTHVKHITQMFHQTGLYNSMLESAFLTKTREFFREQSDLKIENLSVSDYITFGMGVIQVESQLAYLYLEEDSFLRTTECLEEELFRQHQKTIFEGLPDLMMKYPQSQTILRTLFEITEQTQLLPQLAAAWRKFIIETGQKHLSIIKKDTAEKKVYQVIREIV